jgi:hypothetical protein
MKDTDPRVYYAIYAFGVVGLTLVEAEGGEQRQRAK